MSRKGQHIIFGSIFLLFLFFLVITIFFDDLFFEDTLTEGQFDLMQAEAVRVADSLTRQGYPLDWDAGNVRRVGLTTDGLFDHQKQAALDALYASGAGYQDLKGLLGVQHDYLLIVNITASGHTAYGDGTITTEQELIKIKPDFIASQTRYLTDAAGGTIALHLHIYED